MTSHAEAPDRFGDGSPTEVGPPNQRLQPTTRALQSVTRRG
jgi:hypothetical protein